VEAPKNLTPFDRLRATPSPYLLAKERGTRKNSGSPSPCKEKGLGDVVHFLST